MFDKIVKVTANELAFEEGMTIYKMKEGEDNTFDIQKVKWQNRKDHAPMFFIDNDENPFNGEMMLFRKTKFNKFELSSIHCEMPTQNSAI